MTKNSFESGMFAITLRRALISHY